MTTGSVWREFEHDPRDPQYAGIRASDRDRAVVHDVLAAAYAEGRLDRERVRRAHRRGRGRQDLRRAAAADPRPHHRRRTGPLHARPLAATCERQARLYYGEKLREAFFGFLIPNLIVWAIWFMAGHDGFVWPIFVLIPTGANLARVVASRRSIVDARVEKLQRRQAKELEGPKDGTSKPTTRTPRSPDENPEDTPSDG